MFFFDCEKGYVPDNGESNVTEGSVENYPLDWDAAQAGRDEENRQTES